MKYCVVEIVTQTASFRNPEFQNFHKSFFLPPPTTLMGFAGAALGLTAELAQAFFNEDGCKMGVYGTSKAQTTDLWKYNDFENGSVIPKEYLYHNKFFIVYSFENEDKMELLSKSFLQPKYALTMGNSDSLAKIVKVTQGSNTESCIDFKNCLIEGDVVNNTLLLAGNGLEFSIYSTNEPITYNLPVKFMYDKKSLVRKVIARKEYSFITEKIRVNYHIESVVLEDDVVVPLFSIN